MKLRLVFITSLVIVVGILLNIGCSDQVSINDPLDPNSPTAKALLKITDSSPSVNSFTANYSEDGSTDFSGTLGKEFYPFKIRQNLTQTNRTLTLVKDSTTATGTLVQEFEGELIIKGTFQKPTYGVHPGPDTTITKPFSTTITRFIKYEKVSDTGNDTVDWKIVAVSLPAGGTAGEDVQITKLTLTAQDGSAVEITDPGAYFFDVGKDRYNVDDSDEDDDDGRYFGMSAGGNGWGWNFWLKLWTWYKRGQEVTLTVEVLSTSSDPDILTITYGATKYGSHKNKYNFELTSNVQEGNLYRKTYEKGWKVPSYGGRMHAVINAVGRNSAYDSDAAVVVKTWGIPFKVK